MSIQACGTIRRTEVEKDEISIHCNWYRQQELRTKEFEWKRLIDHHSLIANGWTKPEIIATEQFLKGTIMVVDGLLRVMPCGPNDIDVKMTEAVAHTQLARIGGHIAAGGVPILEEETKAAPLEARQYEQQLYGKRPKPDPQQSLFG